MQSALAVSQVTDKDTKVAISSQILSYLANISESLESAEEDQALLQFSTLNTAISVNANITQSVAQQVLQVASSITSLITLSIGEVSNPQLSEAAAFSVDAVIPGPNSYSISLLSKLFFHRIPTKA